MKVSINIAEAFRPLLSHSLALCTREGEFAALKEVLGESGQRDVVNNLLRKITVLQNAVASSDATRRKLHNELVQVKGNVSSDLVLDYPLLTLSFDHVIHCLLSHDFFCTTSQIRVYCRVKPHPMSSVKLMPDQCGLQIAVDGKDHSLEFDRVYGPTATQEQVRTGLDGCRLHGSADVCSKCHFLPRPPLAGIFWGFGAGAECPRRISRVPFQLWADWRWEDAHHAGL